MIEKFGVKVMQNMREKKCRQGFETKNLKRIERKSVKTIQRQDV